jgi:hypothetical protein
MSSPKSKNKRKRKGHVRVPATYVAPVRSVSGSPVPLSSRESMLRQLLFMVVDAAGGIVRIPPRHAERVTTIPMKLCVNELRPEDGGGTMVELIIDASADVQHPAG